MTWNMYSGSADTWDAAVDACDIASVYSLWQWGEHQKLMAWQVIRLCYRDNTDTITALCQVFMRSKFSFVDIFWSPGGVIGDIDTVSQGFISLLKKLKTAPCFYLRLNQLQTGTAELVNMFQSIGFNKPGQQINTGLSMEYVPQDDESVSLEPASSNWRRNFRRHYRYGLGISHWQDATLSDIRAVYQEMEGYKGLSQQFNDEKLRQISESLGERLVLYRCSTSEDKVIALRACAIVGKRAWDILAAANREARKLYASYALFIAVARHSARKGCDKYDMGGIDPENNTSVYNFKKGTGAKLIKYSGEWEYSSVFLLRYLVNKKLGNLIALRRA